MFYHNWKTKIKYCDELGSLRDRAYLISQQHTSSVGSVFYIFDIGPGSCFMLCRKVRLFLFHYYLRFVSQKCNQDLNKKIETFFPQ